MKKILFLGDLHCGSRVGLNPFPDNETQKVLWQKWLDMIKWAGKVDAVVCNGDAIDGKAKNDPTQTEPDRLNQAKLAVECLKKIKTNGFYLTYGTPFHVTSKGGEDYEGLVADFLRQKGFESEIQEYYNNLECDGVKFRVRHKIGGSSIPHGRATAANKERVWNMLNSYLHEEDQADVLIYSHVHYYQYCGDEISEAVTLPCWQAKGSKYGARQCTGRVTNGAVLYECDKGQFVRKEFLFKIVDKYAGKVKL